MLGMLIVCQLAGASFALSGLAADYTAPGDEPCAGLTSYTFTEIARTGSGSRFAQLPVGQALNDRGEIAFVASMATGDSAIYKIGQAGPVVVARSGRADIVAFTASPYMNNDGVVSIVATLTDGATALFTGQGAELTR